MRVHTVSRFQRVAPLKVLLVATSTRGQLAQDALDRLNFTSNHAAVVLLKTLKAATALAKDREMDIDKARVIARVDEGPALKRRILFSRGRSAPMMKKMSHVHIELSDEKEPKSKGTRWAKK